MSKSSRLVMVCLSFPLVKKKNSTKTKASHTDSSQEKTQDQREPKRSFWKLGKKKMASLIVSLPPSVCLHVSPCLHLYSFIGLFGFISWFGVGVGVGVVGGDGGRGAYSKRTSKEADTQGRPTPNTHLSKMAAVIRSAETPLVQFVSSFNEPTQKQKMHILFGRTFMRVGRSMVSPCPGKL